MSQPLLLQRSLKQPDLEFTSTEPRCKGEHGCPTHIHTLRNVLVEAHDVDRRLVHLARLLERPHDPLLEQLQSHAGAQRLGDPPEPFHTGLQGDVPGLVVQVEGLYESDEEEAAIGPGADGVRGEHGPELGAVKLEEEGSFAETFFELSNPVTQIFQKPGLEMKHRDRRYNKMELVVPATAVFA
jgi:hypothetical protein